MQSFVHSKTRKLVKPHHQQKFDDQKDCLIFISTVFSQLKIQYVEAGVAEQVVNLGPVYTIQFLVSIVFTLFVLNSKGHSTSM